MSEKKRKRGRPRMAPALSYGTEFKLRNKAGRIIKKPKYLRQQDDEDEGLAGNCTPLYGHDDILPDKLSNASKIKNSRGYDAQAYDKLKDSEYHYGSDFELEDNSDAGRSNGSSSSSDVSSSSDLGEYDADTGPSHPSEGDANANIAPPMWWKLGPAGNLGIRAHTPVPVWLQDRIFPSFDLPKSSDDLLVPTPLVMKAIGIYEILRHFRALVRLSPFHFEEFCAMLISEEQSILMTEIHICLLKALIREEESQQTHFGPIDQKDSVNIILFFIDSLTWPETLRLYLQSDPEFKSYLKILDSCTYPYASLTQRLDILQFLCDQFLQTAVVREDLISEGKIKYDDHCRFCHKTGDLLCCDSCNAVYHLECVDPPLMHSPAELDDWTCAVCKAQEVEGVTDCLSPMESSGFLCRQEPLGFDRHGRKYWFLIRRIFVESEKGDIWYYSTTNHLDLILSLMDKDDLEEGLFIAFKEFGDDIRRQMKITEELTDEAKGSKPTWILLEIEQLKEEKETLLKLKLKKEDSEAVDKLIEKVYNKEDVKEEKTDGEEDSSAKESGESAKTPEVDLSVEVKTEVKIEPDEVVEDSLPPKEESKEEADLPKLIDQKKQQISSSSCESFRFGCDNSHRSYTNVYVTNALALNKLQHNEERDKKRHLSHKFSLTSNSDFKWSGHTNGTTESVISTVRATLLSMEGNISSHFFHPHWQYIRKTWSQFVFQASLPAHFAKAMRLLISCIKPVVFSTVWNESLGHIRLKRITALEREERKKQEKKEKKEAEDESRLFFFIKYTKGVKHQLWKVKGEEYRLHGLWGWLWNSSLRKSDGTSMLEKGLRAGPDKVTVPIKTQTGVVRGLPINPAAYKQLTIKNKCLQASILSPKQQKLETGETVENEKGHEIIIANAGIQQKVEVVAVNLEEHFEDGLVNISKNLNSRLRLVYPKVAKSSTLDGLLTRRIGLKLQEERELAAKKVEKADDEKMLDIENEDSDSTLSEVSDADNIEELPDSQRSTVHKQKIAGNLLKEINTHKQRYEELDKQDSSLPCYSHSCRETGRSSCYSPSCMLKEKAKQKLVSCVNNYKIVTGSPSPYEQVGTSSPIRFSESDLNESSTPKSFSFTNGLESNESTHKISEKSVGNASDSKLKSDADDSGLAFSEHSSSEKNDRIYSTERPCGKIYLKKYNVESKRTRKLNYKIPPVSPFRYGGKASNRHSPLILPHWELRLMARRGGKYNPFYFNHNAKINQIVWPYPCSRPLFKTTWLYRSTVLPSISAAALQLRIVWACLRWDDMQEKGPSDGRKQVTTEMEIIQTEILKRKYSGRFMERTEYLQRKVIIPFDVPKPVREFTPSQRSGLRKRRRAQSPVSKQPQSLEEWVEEEKLPLWEIKHFGDRLEKATLLNKKTAISEKTNGDTSNFQSISRSTSPAEFKAKIEEQLKIQRATFNQKKAFEVQGIGSSKGIVKVAIGNALSGSKVTIGGSAFTIKGGTAANSGNPLSSLLTGRKIVTTKGGKIITVQAASPLNKSDTLPTKIALGNSSVFPVGSLPKVQVTSQGNKVIRFQTLSTARQRSILPRVGSPNVVTSGSTSAISPIVSSTQAVSTASPTATPVVRPAGQQIHIVRLPDGQVQVRGLQDGQQVIQRSDGKLHLVNKSATPLISTSSTSLPVNQLKSSQKENTLRNISPLSTGQIVKINGQQVLLRPAGPNGKQIVSINQSDVLASGISTNLKTIVSGANTPSAIPFKAVKTQDGIMIKTPISISNSLPSSIIKSPAADSLPSKVTSIPSVGTTTASAPSANKTASTSSNSLTLRVQVRMTEQGPKTIIQGLEPGVGLTKDHIMAIQQQVRSMLSQYNLQVNQLSPLMTLTLQMSNKTTNQSQAVSAKAPQTQGISGQGGTPKQQSDRKVAPTLSEPVPFDATKKMNSVSPSKTVPENIFDQEANDKSPKKYAATNEFIQQNAEDRLVQFQKYTSDKTKESSDLQTRSSDDFSSSKGAKRNRDQDDDWDNGIKAKTKKTKTEKTPKGTKKETLNNSILNAKMQTQEAKRKVARQQKLEVTLSRHKDLLKKDILKKRANLEKELQLLIHKELTIARQHMQTVERSKHGEPTISSKKKSALGNDGSPGGTTAVTSPTMDAPSRLFNQKKNEGLNTSTPNLNNSPSKSGTRSLASKIKRTNKGKNKKIVCICRTPFDDSKFYVGCDLCGNWFHGDCVGITESLSRTMTEYICDDCANAKLNKELFCFCKQPYDEAQFYIFCEKCEGWYHGKCIGIMQQEAEDIDEYICPQCDPSTEWNRPCQKKLTGKDYIELKKISKTLIQHKNAWPFLEPVDQSEVPDYYKVVKEPMDLKSIESKVSTHSYTTVAEFCGDVMLVFDNCRAYNPPNSSFWSCANTLENFFCNKLKQLKQKVGHKS